MPSVVIPVNAKGGYVVYLVDAMEKRVSEKRTRNRSFALLRIPAGGLRFAQAAKTPQLYNSGIYFSGSKHACVTQAFHK